jgi:hypothetical protein
MKFKKKHVVVEAYQTDRELFIETLEGTMRAKPTDWIITGINGEQYPCDNEIFCKTYEGTDQESAAALEKAKRETGSSNKIDPKYWVGLTDEEIGECRDAAAVSFRRYKGAITGQQLNQADSYDWHFAKAIENNNIVTVKSQPGDDDIDEQQFFLIQLAATKLSQQERFFNKI